MVFTPHSERPGPHHRHCTNAHPLQPRADAVSNYRVSGDVNGAGPRHSEPTDGGRGDRQETGRPGG